MRYILVLLTIPLSFCCVQQSVQQSFIDELKSGKHLYPFDGFSYDNISVELRNDTIYVRAKCSELEGEDIYVFVNEEGRLILRSYCLEALPGSVKLNAIELALSNETIKRNASGIVTVRRILPQTSAKFYIPKELFSVTWHGGRIVSALVDLDEGKVVRVYVG